MLRSTRKRNFEDMQHSEVGEEFIRAPSYDSVCVFVCVCVCLCVCGWVVFYKSSYFKMGAYSCLSYPFFTNNI